MSTSWESPVLGAVPLEARMLAEAPELCQEWTGERIHAG